jgi:hypothetical protein
MRLWIPILLLSICANAQSNKPALTTRKDFANANLLFSLEDIIGTTEVTRYCIRIQPDGRFQREKGSTESKAKFGEAGQLSPSELTQLKAMLNDPEFKALRQDPNAFMKSDNPSAGYKKGHKTFKLTVVRDGVHRQNFFFSYDPESNTVPAKIQIIQNFVSELEQRKDASLQRVAADGCRPHVATAPPSQK